MRAPSQIPLIKGDKIANNGTVDYRDALPVNMFAVLHPVKGARGYMHQDYGYIKLADTPGASRGGKWVSAPDLKGEYRVFGNDFVRINSDGSQNILGTIPASGQCSLAYSFQNIAIVGGSKLYYWNPSDGLREILSSCIDVVWSDNVFIATDGNFVFHSSFADEEVFLPVDIDNASFRPDPTFGLGVNKDSEVLAFGSKSTQYYSFRALENFAFVPNRNKNAETGISGIHAKIKFFDKWYTVGRRNESKFGIHVIRGGDSRDVSTREIKKILAEQDDLSRVTIDATEKEGVKLVRFHLPSAVITLNVNVLESDLGYAQSWSIAKTDVVGEAPLRAKDYVYSGLFDDWTVGDKRAGIFGIVSDTVATHYEEVAEWILYTPLIDFETLSIDEIKLETIPGFNLAEDATVAVSTTTRGLIYSGEYWQEYGHADYYRTRFIIRVLGIANDWMGFKFRGASTARMVFSRLMVSAS